MDETLADAADDLNELHVLAASALGRLTEFQKHLTERSGDYMPSTSQHLRARAEDTMSQYELILNDLNVLLQERSTWNDAQLPELIACKKKSADRLRILQSEMGSVLSAGNWQSPSYEHTHISQAGADTGTIRAGSNDYRRDWHADERRYADAFCSAYIDHPLRLAPSLSVTSSGMAAITATLTSLADTVKPTDVVLVGQSTYFQSRWVLEKLFAGQIIYVDEFVTDEIIRLAEKHKPALIFLDTLCNAPQIPVLNLHVLVPALAKVLSQTSTLVLDNTGLATTYQPLADLRINPFGMRFVMVESLLKYHQFGLDRVGAGVAWEPRDLRGEEVMVARMHGGTIVPDASVTALPEPNRELLDKRLRRLGRNAQILAERIDAAARAGKGVVLHAVYPGLPTYPGYAWTKDMPFHGGFLTLAFTKSHESIAHYDRFVSRVLARAQEKNIDLVGGTSFGFNTTRISVPARYAGDAARPFVRIAAGTETHAEIDAIAEVFEEIIRA